MSCLAVFRRDVVLLAGGLMQRDGRKIRPLCLRGLIIAGKR